MKSDIENIRKALVDSELLPNLQQKIVENTLINSNEFNLKEAVRLELFPTEIEKDRKEYFKLTEANKEIIAKVQTKSVI